MLALAPPSTAEVGGTRYRELSAPSAAQTFAPWAAERTLRFQVVPDGIRIRGTWTIRAQGKKKRFFDGALLSATAHIHSIRWNGRTAATYRADGASPVLHVVGVVEGEAQLEVDATLVQSTSTPFSLLAATTGTSTVEGGDDLLLRAVKGAALWRESQTATPLTVGGAEQLQLSTKAAPANTGTLATGLLATGVTFSDATAIVQARAQWNVRRGELREVVLRATGVSADLQVEGPNVARWTREGDSIRVELRENATDAVVVTLNWTLPLKGGSDATFSLPTLELEQTFGVEKTLQLARDGELDILPALPEWSAVAHRELSSSATGLIEGVVTASFRGTQSTSGGDITLLRFEPVPGPAATIDVAALDVALSAEGAALLVARYEVQNERASHLGIQLPNGARILGVKVAGRAVAPVRDGDEFRIPLPRSVETLRGLLSVPVVVGYTMRGKTWKRRHSDTLPLPIVDLPIQTHHISVGLPRRYTSRIDPGTGGVVEAFDQGLHVAHGLQDPDAIADADATLGRAAKAWNANEFDVAQRELDNFRAIGGEGFADEQLQSNVDLVVTATVSSRDSTSVGSAPAPASATDISGKSLGLARRIKGRARSRSMKKRVRQSSRKQRARELKNQGRYDEAKAEYKRALDDSKDLRKLDETESQTYAAEEEEILLELDEVETEQSNRTALESSAPRKLWSEEVDLVPLPRVPPSQAATSARASALIVLPKADETVRYQLTLLPAGAKRSVPYRVRRQLRR